MGTIIDDSWPVVPMVAWRIVGDLHLAEPITPEMVSEVQHYVVLCPDGRVYSRSGGASYASRTEYIKAMNSRPLLGKRDETEDSLCNNGCIIRKKGAFRCALEECRKYPRFRTEARLDASFVLKPNKAILVDQAVWAFAELIAAHTTRGMLKLS